MVPRMEMTMDPTHPLREEKNANMRLSRARLAGRLCVRKGTRAKKPIDEFPRNGDRNQTKDPAKHGGLSYGFTP